MFVLDKINREEALRYMGCRGGQPDEGTLAVIDDCEKALIAAAVPRYLYRRFDGVVIDKDSVTITEAGIRLRGRSIAEHLDGCESAVLMCATISSGVDKLIRRCQTTDMAKAVITDALASAAIEQVCNAAEEEIGALFPDEYKTWRFSPGYGDLPLEHQGELLRVLDAQRKIGLTLGRSTMLIPTKSVTAVIGISSSELPRRKRSCACCTMAKNCKFRKTGERCV